MRRALVIFSRRKNLVSGTFKGYGGRVEPFGAHGGLKQGIVSAHLEPHPFALRAKGPASGCPNSFQTNLSNRWVLIPVVTIRNAKRPNRGALHFWRREWDSNPR